MNAKKILLFVIIIQLNGFLFAQTDTAALFNAVKYSKLEKWDSASYCFIRAGIPGPGFTGTNELYIQSMIKTSNFDLAEKQLQTANSKKSNALIMAKACLFLNTGKENLAIDELKKALKEKNNPVSIEIIDSKDLETLRSLDAWADVEKLMTEPDYSLSDARLEIKYKRPERALELIEAVLTDKPNSSMAWFLKAQANWMQKESEKAYLAINKAIGLSPENMVYRTLKAQICSKLAKTSEAIAELNKIVEQNPFDAEVLAQRASLLIDAGRFETAKTDLEIIGKYAPSVENEFLLAGLFTKSGNYHESLKILNKILTDDPSKPQYFIARGDIFMQTGNFTAARADYCMALDLQPTGATYLKHGQARAAAGNIEEAIFDFQRAIDMGEKSAWEYLKKYNKNANN
jgi:tetratricopeptide (TPR) repeat protein